MPRPAKAAGGSGTAATVFSVMLKNESPDIPGPERINTFKVYVSVESSVRLVVPVADDPSIEKIVPPESVMNA